MIFEIRTATSRKLEINQIALKSTQRENIAWIRRVTQSDTFSMEDMTARMAAAVSTAMEEQQAQQQQQVREEQVTKSLAVKLNVNLQLLLGDNKD